MFKFVDPFIYNLPSIDLHGFDRVSARIKVEEFINDNIKLHNKKLIIIHGRGTGVIKDEVHKCLKNNKNVLEYKLYYNNVGQTIVTLKWHILFLTYFNNYDNIFERKKRGA